MLYLAVERTALTDVVIVMAHVELVAQGEGAVTLELLGELDGHIGGMGCMWLVALPPFEASLWVTGVIAMGADHV